VRTNIMFMAPDQPHRRLLITSAGPMEGKTTVACCVAIAMAQAGQRVLLLDCDLRRPRVHRIFDRRNDTGVTTALLDMSSLNVAALQTQVPNLSVLTSGPIPPNPAELLQSDAFERLLTELSKSFDRIVIDSPPVVPVTDAAVLSTRVDGCVLVIRAFKTTKELARQALRALRDVAAPTVGAVLNAVDLGRQEYGYYHYYYYKAEGYRLRDDEIEPPPPPPGTAQPPAAGQI
jgi:capsular exopolysaccharide synthesis family protein